MPAPVSGPLPSDRSSPSAIGRVVADGRLSLLLLTCVPLVLAPGGLDRFTFPKLAVAALGVLAAVPAARRGALPRSVVVLVGLGTLWLVVAALASDAPLAQLVGRWPRYEGLVALPVYVGAVWAGARLLGPGAPVRVVAAWVRMLVVVAVVLAVVSAVEAVGLRPLGGDVARPGALLGNATDQGVTGMLLVALLVPHAIARLSSRPGSGPVAWLGPVVGVVAALIVVVSSGSRAAILSTVVVGAVLSLASGRPAPGGLPRRAPARLLPLAVSALVLAGAALLPASRDRLTGADPLAAATVEGRVDLWASAARLVAENPLVGAGPSGFVDGYVAHRSVGTALSSNPALAPDSPHAWPLQAAVAGGGPLLLCALALAAVVLVVGVRRVRETNGPALAGDDLARGHRSLAHGAFAAVVGASVALSSHFTTVGVVVVAGLAVGALVAVPVERAPARRLLAGLGDRAAGARQAAAATAVGVGSLCVVLALAAAAEVPLARATAAAARGDVATATTSFDQARALRPWDGDVAMVAALTFSAGAEAGHGPSAQATIEHASRALEDHPASAEARVALALGHVALSDDAAAAPVLDEILARGEDPRARLLRGVVAARAGDLTLARAHLTVAARSPWTADLARRNLEIVDLAQRPGG
ncbi:O-antigen ligase family protein [Oerskovia turbata]